MEQNRGEIPPGLVDLAAERLGGRTLVASDEFFAPKENLLKPGRGVSIPDKYTERGKWMDGWETRRRRTPGNDWCVVQLGLPGMIRKVDIDTNYFLGNHPPFASLEALEARRRIPRDAASVERLPWAVILPKSPLHPGSQNIFDVSDDRRWTHVRLSIYPDGGVARLRVYGIVLPDWSKYRRGMLIDLAGIQNGGMVLACSDMFFSSMNNLILPGRAKNMGDGWETKRRRGPGHDWIIVKLGRPGRVRKVELDTQHFKGNYPDMCSLDACNAIDDSVDILTTRQQWNQLLPRTKLQPDKRHSFTKQLKDVGIVTHVRLNIIPDGGVSRLRVWGMIE